MRPIKLEYCLIAWVPRGVTPPPCSKVAPNTTLVLFRLPRCTAYVAWNITKKGAFRRGHLWGDWGEFPLIYLFRVHHPDQDGKQYPQFLHMWWDPEDFPEIWKRPPGGSKLQKHRRS